MLLRRLREGAALTQEELADRAGLTSNAIGALERGERRRPYPHTVRVLADALGLDDHARAELAAAAKPTPGVPRAAEPAGTTPMVGRQRELGQIVALLTDRSTRLLTVTGPGGVGKTRLALEAARRVVASSGDPLLVVELAAVSDPDLVLPTVAQVLALPHAASSAALSAIATYLGDRRRLLLLDNAEQVVAAAGDIGRLLEACPGLLMLVTSRAPLRIRGEQDFPLAPLDVPTGSGVAAVEDSDAARLLVQRAQEVSPGFVVTERTAAAIAQICRQLDGLPLALELAAAHARLLGPDALLSRLDRAVSSPLARDRPERHSTMRSTLDWSHALLTHEEQVALRRLAVFAGGFTLDAAEAVVGEEVDAFGALSGLVDQSMVVVQHGSERYRLLEPVRQYAAGRLAEARESEVLADAHAAWLCALGRAARVGLRGHEQGEWLDRLGTEHGNVRAALARLLEARRTEEACRLLADVWLGWAVRGKTGEGLDWAHRIRERSEWQPLSEEALVHLEDAVSGFLFATGDMTATTRAAQVAADLARSTRSAVWAETLILLGSGQLFSGAPEPARRTLSEATAIADAAADPWASLHARLAEGMRLVSLGATDQAAPVLADAVDRARALGNPFSLATALSTQGSLSLTAGDDDEALEHFLEAARLAVDTGMTWNWVYALSGIATVAARRGEPDLAAMVFAVGAMTSAESALAVAFPPDLAFAEAALVQVRAALGDDRFTAAYARGLDADVSDVLTLAGRLRRP